MSSVCCLYVVPLPWNLFKASHRPSPVTWSLPRPLIGQSTMGQNWVHPHSLCVDALQFDPWCTLNWSLALTGHMVTSKASHWSNHQKSKLSASTRQSLCGCTQFWPLVHSKMTPTWQPNVFCYQYYFPHTPKDSVSPVYGIFYCKVHINGWKEGLCIFLK